MCSLMVEKMTKHYRDVIFLLANVRFSDLRCISRPQFTGSHFPQTIYCGFVCHVVFYRHKSSKAGRGHQETERAVCFALLKNMCGSRPK